MLMRVTVLKDELEVTMRLCGITSLGQASPDLLNTSDVDHLVRVDQRFPEIPLKLVRSKI